MIRTRGLSQINLNVSDLERSARFYQRVFGLELLTEAEPQGRGGRAADGHRVEEIKAAELLH